MALPLILMASSSSLDLVHGFPPAILSLYSAERRRNLPGQPMGRNDEAANTPMMDRRRRFAFALAFSLG
jgi:hypothetical protein